MLGGIVAGVITSLTTVLVLCKVMGLSHKDYVTLLPKSITTAIGMGVSEELGGYVTITVAVIVVTGVIGNIIGEIDPTRKKEKPMSEKLTIANPEDGNRPLSYQALSHGIDELRLGDMGITDAVWRGPHSELVALARRILDAEAGR